MKAFIQKILMTLLVGMLVIACSDDWLDETSNAKITADQQFSDEDGFKDALMGVYLGMTSPKLYAKDMTWNLVDLLAQQYATLPSLALYDEVQQFNYRGPQATDQVDALWIRSYNILANINLALEYIDDNQEVLNPINYAIIKGELLGLRVFVHLDLMRLYGYGNLEERQNLMGEYTIPYVVNFDKDLVAPMTYAQTFDRMQEDIDMALELLKEDPIYQDENRPADYYLEVNRTGFYENREQRMNYYAVKALEARKLLWEGNTSDAAVAAEAVIANSGATLIQSDSYPIAGDPILYQEVLFCLDINGFADIVNPILTASDDGTNYDAIYLTTQMADSIFETDQVNIGLADVRFNTLLKSETRGLVSTKLIQSGTNNPNQMPLIKLPEMYYIAAEHYWASENLEQAITYLNTVRSSRGILDSIPLDSDSETVWEELRKEYRKEFISEGQLFYFYKRTGETEIPFLSETVELNDEIYVLPYPDSEAQFVGQN
ncbi:RagB/SusD family nutrient uptake outer membrane protein [Muricauda ruestringensis]|uniref:RagB/SusD family nutrient uptake outer membrane protein n=1 Tax=Flagellimonas marinaquae TaxID=254955 RepID=A0AA48HSB4_9FLAO|nr:MULTISPECIES: RagB/SusD family nutrient uptake outer membrane protein [Allomuricauda]MCA0957624.1 RagB/SusD family nutrient uptake outer membrane protein [Allomuricauda ruestringensis]USD24454.1 RagB/SusD family nutrient uptake outer membrane protein [Allomuricauda aquimarina]BDW93491.1 hypothetical protein MACH07_23230 [Allomuricauda aquimarina]